MSRVGVGSTVSLVLAFSAGSATQLIAATRAVAVRLAVNAQGCRVAAPKQGQEQGTNTNFKRHVFAGDTVTWTIRNDCTVAKDVGVGNFRMPNRPPYTTIGSPESTEPREYPLAMGGSSLTVRVPTGQSLSISAQIRTDIHFHPRTWEYDILDYGGPTPAAIGDPEIEIPN